MYNHHHYLDYFLLSYKCITVFFVIYCWQKSFIYYLFVGILTVILLSSEETCENTGDQRRQLSCLLRHAFNDQFIKL